MTPPRQSKVKSDMTPQPRQSKVKSLDTFPSIEPDNFSILGSPPPSTAKGVFSPKKRPLLNVAKHGASSPEEPSPCDTQAGMSPQKAPPGSVAKHGKISKKQPSASIGKHRRVSEKQPSASVAKHGMLLPLKPCGTDDKQHARTPKIVSPTTPRNFHNGPSPKLLPPSQYHLCVPRTSIQQCTTPSYNSYTSSSAPSDIEGQLPTVRRRTLKESDEGKAFEKIGPELQQNVKIIKPPRIFASICCLCTLLMWHAVPFLLLPFCAAVKARSLHRLGKIEEGNAESKYARTALFFIQIMVITQVIMILPFVVLLSMGTVEIRLQNKPEHNLLSFSR